MVCVYEQGKEEKTRETDEKKKSNKNKRSERLINEKEKGKVNKREMQIYRK